MPDPTKNTGYLPLEGVNSEHCARIIDKALSSVEGLKVYTVELNNHRVVLPEANNKTVAAAVQKIRDFGYNVPTVKTTFPVLEMSCASCAKSVETMLQSQTGVLTASVNFASASVLVEYIPGMITPAAMKSVIQSIGYDLMITEKEDSKNSLETIRAKNYAALKSKTIGAVILSLPVMIIAMFFMDMPYANSIMWVLSTPVVMWYGKDFFINAWKQARHRSANMDTLVALSTGVAYIFSVFNTVYPKFWMDRGLHVHVYFEASAVVIAFILIGKLLEEKAKGNTSAALKKLIGLQPKTVTLVQGENQHVQVSIERVKKGDTILVKPGEKIAVDGIVTSGNSYVDESMLSGEPVAVLKNEGIAVFAGTINQKGSFQFRAEKVGAETMLSQIIKTVEEAQGSKAPVQKLVDKIAAVFVPVVIAIALITLVVWVIFGGENGLTQGLMAMVTVLVIACPCALGLATPTAIMVGVGKGAENGILIKDAESLESAKKINAVVLDKTGTITEGKPVVTDIFWLHGNDDAKINLVNLERQSEHPLAEAVITYYKDLPQTVVTHFESITGKGARGQINQNNYFAGTKSLLQSNQILIDAALEKHAHELSQDAKTVIWFADSEKALAVIAIADKIKETSVEAIRTMQAMGIEVYMLTGDNETTAQSIAAKTGITAYQSEVLPHQKADFIKKLKASGKIVAMVGDGINDSTALAEADVSIAMGKGSDIAMDVAKMTIISSDLNKIPTAIKLSRQTVAAIRQNLFWAFIYNVIGIPLGAGILYPINGFLLNPMIAGAAMALSSVSVVSNSLRLRFKK
ncbi:MAG: copper-translocating P-type ATPase [Bacteroidetes bacterium]|nr:copper-translocating P-type ATPase [Bacteroidota bacterium]